MADIEQLITGNLDIWSSAIKTKAGVGRGSSKKRELYGIKKLRGLILELAVRGLLVPQEPNDEPASELLKKIVAEKAQLIKDKKIKKQKPLPPISDEKKPFDLPKGWEFSRLGETFNSISSGGTPSKRNPDYWGGDIPWASVKDLGSRKYIVETQDYITEDGLNNGSRLAATGDVLICTRMGLGKIAAVKVSMAYNQDLKAVSLSSHCNVDFFLNAYATFKIIGTGTTVKGIKQEQLLEYIIGLPPADEQHRIVAKVDELMALCDQLEQQTETSLTAHQTLVETVLAALTRPTAPSAGSEESTGLQTAGSSAKPATLSPEAILFEHFDTLFTTQHSIDQLKQTILQLAVMGKLVPQNPNDEPASELLKKIAAEKAQLIKDKKIKKQKPLPPISDEEKSFELPVGWEWERLQNFSIVGTGSTPPRDNFDFYNPPEFNWVTSGETSKDFICETKEKVSEKAIKETNVSIYPVGTLIVAMYGQGKTRGQITELKIEAGTNQACAAIQMIEGAEEHRGYIKLFFKKAYEELRSQAAGGAQPNLNVGKISSTVVPIPPLNAQHRIVAKVDELMTLCDQLKAHLDDAQTTQLHLADALAEQAIV
ncbi:MAG: restriction endonuclease subunit S [Candidatus Reddybacter sp.]